MRIHCCINRMSNDLFRKHSFGEPAWTAETQSVIWEKNASNFSIVNFSWEKISSREPEVIFHNKLYTFIIHFANFLYLTFSPFVSVWTLDFLLVYYKRIFIVKKVLLFLLFCILNHTKLFSIFNWWPMWTWIKW